jgi:hypothetical protein
MLALEPAPYRTAESAAARRTGCMNASRAGVTTVNRACAGGSRHRHVGSGDIVGAKQDQAFFVFADDP